MIIIMMVMIMIEICTNLRVCTVLKESKLCTDNCNCEEFYFSMFVS